MIKTIQKRINYINISIPWRQLLRNLQIIYQDLEITQQSLVQNTSISTNQQLLKKVKQQIQDFRGKQGMVRNRNHKWKKNILYFIIKDKHRKKNNVGICISYTEFLKMNFILQNEIVHNYLNMNKVIINDLNQLDKKVHPFTKYQTIINKYFYENLIPKQITTTKVLTKSTLYQKSFYSRYKTDNIWKIFNYALYLVKLRTKQREL